MSIVSWGKRERYKFSSCGSFSGWAPPVVSGLYAITYKQDPKNKPKSHTVLYFGEADDLSQQSTPQNKKVVDFWLEGGRTLDDLFVFVHPMEGAPQSARAKVQERLVIEYQPQVNEM